ncbi:calcium-binding protein [Inquilinus limosus]|uniref:calcium-binding protein n=1 Tax=Inquilinus limosus TaxID=171674 RepID=UPI00042A2E4F|nr:calcium-binding protein [Inquilinus limosus]
MDDYYYVFSVDGAETAAIRRNGGRAVVNNLDFFDTTDNVTGDYKLWCTLAFDIGGDIDLDLTSYPGITGFQQVQARSATGGVHLTINGVYQTSAESLSNSPVVLDASATDWPVFLRALSDGFNELIGGAYDDELSGGAGADKLHGGAGADSLGSGAGADVLYGGAGADVLYGGDGIDIASYFTGSTGVVVDLATGTASGGDAQGDSLLLIENLSGSQGDDHLTGDALANTLQGWKGNDEMTGADGNDTVEGGDGNDSLSGDIGADVLRGGAGADNLDGGSGEGSDTVSYYLSSIGVTVNLATGTGHGGDAEGDTLTGFEILSGSQGDDYLTGDALANSLQGWKGNDVLEGGIGKDVLTGGAGADRFVFTTIGDSLYGANSDRITDFSRAQGDKIDLSAIDADTGVAGDQAFSVIGTAPYSDVAGQLRYHSNGIITTIAGDVDGDGVSDFHIRLTGNLALVVGDFIL